MSARPYELTAETKHVVRRDGMAHLRCSICRVEGPPYRTGGEARRHMTKDGWSRCYTGSEDSLRCPDCRSTRPHGSNQYSAGGA